jgi:D,D-heptose 1,7-bisphosphate phosphatase
MKAVFIDKDGTLIKNIPYNIEPLLISFEKNVINGLKFLHKYRFKKIIISNQPGVAYGYYKEDELEKVEMQIQKMLDAYKIEIDAFYYCPHHPEGRINKYAVECSCRKPLPGLINKAAKDFDIDLSASWMVGDILNDIEAGNKAGCSTILINNGGETQWIMNEQRKPDYIVEDFLQAANIICNA